MSKRIVFFNHKGGVSKTTSAYNVGWAIANKGFRVLLVDGDPQCNLSSLILGDKFEPYYLEPATADKNIKEGVTPAFKGKPTPITPFDCPFAERQPRLFLLPGHADLSEYDASLTLAFTSSSSLAALQSLPGAFSALISAIEDHHSIDFTLIDLNPGLSSINQDMFLLSNAFIVPTNPDPFSLMALTTLSNVLPRWANWKTSSAELYADAAYQLPPGLPKFLGTLIQRFNVRNGVAAKPYRNNITEIQEKVTSSLLPQLRKTGMALSDNQYGADLISKGFCLETIPDFQGLLPKAIKAGVPVFQIEDSEIGETGPVLEGMMRNRDRFSGFFNKLADNIVELSEHA